MNLKVTMPMLFKEDNKGTKDLLNNWSVDGRTSHVGACILRELKDTGVLSRRIERFHSIYLQGIMSFPEIHILKTSHS
jgi:hypothetical protein